MQINKKEITTITSFFTMDPNTHQLVVSDEDHATVVNIVKCDKEGGIISSVWGEVEGSD